LLFFVFWFFFELFAVTRHMTSLRPATALRAEQIEKIVTIYKQCRTGLENLWAMTEAKMSVGEFDNQSDGLKNVTRDLGKNETLNQLYSRLPEAISSAALDFCSCARLLWGNKTTAMERSVAGQKRAILLALINELLGSLSKRERRSSKTTDDIGTDSQRASFGERQMAASTSSVQVGLHSMVARGDALSLLRVVKGGADVNGRDANKRTALMIAAALGKTDQAKVLVAHKADPNLMDTLGCTALLLCCSKGYYEMARFLLDNGADPKLGSLKARPLEYLLRFDPGVVPENLQVCSLLMDVLVLFVFVLGDSADELGRERAVCISARRLFVGNCVFVWKRRICKHAAQNTKNRC
jgi:hypothetical protein